MLALAASLALAGYLIVPELLYRLVLGVFLPLRSILRTRSEELARALMTFAIPCALAVFLVHSVPGFKSWPWQEAGGDQARHSDYSLLADCIVSEKAIENSQGKFYPALVRSAHRQFTS